jgi:hypothetical protein
MLRSDKRAYPHAIYALHGNDSTRAIEMLAREHLGAEFGDPAQTGNPVLERVLRGDLAPRGCLFVSVESANLNCPAFPPRAERGASLPFSLKQRLGFRP